MEADSDELYDMAVNFADRYFQENNLDLNLVDGKVSVYNLEDGYLAVKLVEDDVLVEVGSYFNSSENENDIFRDREYRSFISDLDDFDSVFEYLRDSYDSFGSEEETKVHFPSDEPVIDDLLEE